MQTLFMLVGFWLLLLGIYFAWPRVRGIRSGRLGLRVSGDLPSLDLSLSQRYREGIAAAAASLENPSVRRAPAVVGIAEASFEEGLSSEIDFLRLQLEELRAEISSISRRPAPERQERPHLGRYRTGANAYLPLLLRRQVSEVRSRRRMSAA